MNDRLSSFAREQIKKGLLQCSEDEIKNFKRMYSSENLNSSIDEVVDNMPTDKLDWAMQQVERTISKKGLLLG